MSQKRVSTRCTPKESGRRKHSGIFDLELQSLLKQDTLALHSYLANISSWISILFQNKKAESVPEVGPLKYLKVLSAPCVEANL